MGEGPAGGSLALNVTTAIVTFASAALIFQVGWRESEARVWNFSSFADVNKADWSARWAALGEGRGLPGFWHFVGWTGGSVRRPNAIPPRRVCSPHSCEQISNRKIVLVYV